MFAVERKPLVWITLNDGIRLAAKLWQPVQREENSEETFPAILEYLPYRRNDFTSVRDEKRHPWMSSHGYVVIRVDMRGTGDSDGLYYDEYEKQELDDCVEVISWIRRQPWCSGSVGMLGKSWGGFNGLQVASRNPEGLKAVISVCSTDDRYDDNSHFKQGCVVASQMLSWSCYMFIWNSAPPDPLYVGDRWKDIWLRRLENNEPWINKWLSHQTRDEYWKHGSVCEDYSKIKCGVFLIGGWADTYRNAIFRMAENLTCDWRALIGPWPHSFPDDANPGPRIGYLQQSLRFWDYHLKGSRNGLDSEPRLQFYLQESIPAIPAVFDWPGRWVSENQWPSPNVVLRKFEMTLSGCLRGLKLDEGISSSSQTGETVAIGSPFSCGAAACDLIPGNQPGLLPGDQGWQDGQCQCWVGDPVEEPVDILGVATLEIIISSDKPVASLCARLVDVFPDGKATLISTAILNLTHFKGHTSELIENLDPEGRYSILLSFDAIGYTLSKGHRIRLALSQSHWPNLIWPPPCIASLLLHFQPTPPILKLPIRNRSEEIRNKDNALADLGKPISTPPLPVNQLTKASTERYFVFDMVNNSYRSVLNTDCGKLLRTDTKLCFGRNVNEVYHITENEPLSAKVVIKTNQCVGREETVSGDNLDVFSTDVKIKSTMWADEECFHIDSNLKAWYGEDLVFEKQWVKQIKRDHV